MREPDRSSGACPERLAAGALALAALVTAGVALGARGYSDPAGDANAAPDITALEISEATERPRSGGASLAWDFVFVVR